MSSLEKHVALIIKPIRNLDIYSIKELRKISLHEYRFKVNKTSGYRVVPYDGTPRRQKDYAKKKELHQ